MARVSKLEWFLRFLIAGAFLWAGAPKIADPNLFLIQIRAYEILPDPWAAVTAYVLPWLEVICAICILLGRALVGAYTLIIFSMLAFLGGTMTAWMRGLEISCGCFAGWDPSYPVRIIRNIVIIGICIFLMIKASRRESLSKR